MGATTLAIPAAHWLDAGDGALDEPALRHRARAICERSADARHSRSYRYPYALLAGHEREVGVDVERLEPLGPEFAESICTPQERVIFGPRLAEAGFASTLWSSKEALAKALGDALRYDPRRLESPMLWPDGEAGDWRAAELDAPPGHIAWVCWRL